MPSFRYRLQPYSGPKSRYTCPTCGKSRTFTRWIDTLTGEQLPEQFGRCNREDNCGHSLSPYDKNLADESFATAARLAQKSLLPLPSYARSKRLPPQLHIIPDDVVKRTLCGYEHNHFAQLLYRHLGISEAHRLLQRFEVGTSVYWPGATIFWQRDELRRMRNGQVVLFDSTGHTAKRTLADGTQKRCTTWVHHAYARQCRLRNKPQPDWLAAYLNPANEVKKTPCLYGLSQLALVPKGSPVAVVEAPKTAILCTAYFPDYTWFAVGALGYLNAERLRPLKAYPITLFPDASPNGTAFAKWHGQAIELRQQGFDIRASNLLESCEEAQQLAGIDLADWLIANGESRGYPAFWD